VLWNAKELHGYTIRTTDGGIGKVHDFYFDDESWIVDYLMVYIGSWLSGRMILIPHDVLGRPDDKVHILPVALTKKQVKNAPDIDTERPVSRQRRNGLPSDWPVYWGGGRLLIAGAFSIYPSKKAKREKSSGEDQNADLHLRSTREVMGYRIQGNDGKIGYVDNFVVDDETWAIRTMVIGTRKWLPGRKIKLPTQWVDEISWPEHRVHVNSQRETIRNLS
jgi:sporulation protein YlmC with PRC-barrel domain